MTGFTLGGRSREVDITGEDQFSPDLFEFQNHSFTINRLSPTIGAELLGVDLSKEISIMVDNVRKLFSCPSMRSLLGQYRSMAQRSKSAKHRTRPMMRNLMRPLRFKKSLLAENIFLMLSSHSQGGVGAEVESWPPRKTRSRYSSWCFSWNLAWSSVHLNWPPELNW